MTRLTQLASPLLLGFEEIERMVEKIARSNADGYPPYNIERLDKDGATRLRITLAVAGFASDELDVSVENNQLVISGRQENDPSREYLHRGIAARQFQKTFVLANGIEIAGAELENGLLAIELIGPKPQQTARRIQINAADKSPASPASSKE
ncbi:MAG: Hsp20 family protein [Nitratireductor sp.]|nr:Hsp20 family protein [Nitratireductor sp.]